MRDRASVWGDPRVQELAKRFIPSADEVWYLQHARNQEGDLFRKVAEQGHYAGRTVPTDTRQGIYATTVGGTLLASINTNDAGQMAKMLEKALAKWDALSAEERCPEVRMDEAAVRRGRAEARFPSDGVALVEYTRDLPRDSAAKDWRGTAWNIDHVWLAGSEAKDLVPLEATVGARREVPAHLPRRVAMFHLVDFVFGQTPPYERSHVEKASMVSEVTAVEGDLVRVRLTGEFRVVAKGRWIVPGMDPQAEKERGFEGGLLGRAAWNAKAGKLESMDLVVLGKRWGATQYNCRSDDQAPSPVGFAFRLAGDAPADRVPPAFAFSDYWAK